MKKCQAPDHPHCTHWVAEGEAACAAGHLQAAGQHRQALLNASADGLRQAIPHAADKAHLHFSGYDPRAAGGRQTIKLELPVRFAPGINMLEVQLTCELLAAGMTKQRLLRTMSGQWQPLLLSFSSRNKEHGQYPLQVTILHQQDGMVKRKWLCTSVIFVPRANATLTEIHSVFLATQKNVRVMAEDGAIASLSGLGQAGGYAQGNMHIEISAKDAAIAKLDMRPPTGKYEIALGAVAWDEELIEVAATNAASAPPATTLQTRQISGTAKTAAMATKWASLIVDQPGSPSYNRIRLFALDEWVLGRWEEQQPQADILLSHRGSNAAENARLSRRISARHAIIRRNAASAELIDVSRYGVLLDGVSLEKDRAYPLRTGMRIEFCATVRGIAILEVVDIQAHVILLAEIDQTIDSHAVNKTPKGISKELLFLLTPETQPMSTSANLPGPSSPALPVLFHFQGGFWHRNKATQQETRLDENADLRVIPEFSPTCRYSSLPYAEIKTYGLGRMSI
ncbi:FHA domain-containing protein [Undibacterium sp. TS12]|uniref:FHA domain-containing protein n=1 Tax=Undibacterium sp. TS12 TaxID=2908202 RepID=UPI001F4CE348|nr:FHA domain-containing protein [Undibacterium sp. TS12]MCH8618172.1 FHA domain-containing protein [Undibacterium sp. TS12]